jgi:hypothetical protein
MMVLVGYTVFTVAVAARLYAVVEEIGPPAPRIAEITAKFTLERGLALGGVVLGCGLVLIGWTVVRAFRQDLTLETLTMTLRPTIIGSTMVALGVQTVLMSFFYSMLGVPRRAKTIAAAQ